MHACPIVKMVGSLINSVPKGFEKDVKSLLQKLCDIAILHRDGRTRYEAFVTLLIIREKLPPYITLPYQAIVLSKIKPGMDDPLRPVRSAAVKCSSGWHIYQMN